MENIIMNLFNGTDIKINASALVKLGIILLLTVAACIALSVLQKKLKRKYDTNNDLRKAQFLKIAVRVARIIAISVGVIAALQALGINLTGITSLFGILVIIIALAVKDALQDVFNGLIIVQDKYFSVGDAVEYEGKDGIVISLTARTTKIEFLDDRSVLSVANRNISRIRKLTHLVDIDLPLPYELSAKEAYEALSSICLKINAIDGIESCELKGTQDFGASAIIYKIRFFCEPHNRPDIRRAVIKTIQDGLEHAGIQIPYQQIDIHSK